MILALLSNRRLASCFNSLFTVPLRLGWVFRDSASSLYAALTGGFATFGSILGCGLRIGFSSDGACVLSAFLRLVRAGSIIVELCTLAAGCDTLFCVRVVVWIFVRSPAGLSFSLMLATLKARLTLTVVCSSLSDVTISDFTLFNGFASTGSALGNRSLGPTAAVNNGKREPCLR